LVRRRPHLYPERSNVADSSVAAVGFGIIATRV
jgi:hypothetical protein